MSWSDPRLNWLNLWTFEPHLDQFDTRSDFLNLAYTSLSYSSMTHKWSYQNPPSFDHQCANLWEGLIVTPSCFSCLHLVFSKPRSNDLVDDISSYRDKLFHIHRNLHSPLFFSAVIIQTWLLYGNIQFK